mgnify:CR=1 FL=1
MGDVDDDLIADAHTVTKKVRLPMRHFAALAACLVLFFGALIYVGLPGTDIIIDGNPMCLSRCKTPPPSFTRRIRRCGTAAY